MKRGRTPGLDRDQATGRSSRLIGRQHVVHPRHLEHRAAIRTGKRPPGMLILVLAGASLFRLFTFPTRIVGASMEPTLYSGQYCLMKRCWPVTPVLERFDIVTARVGGELVTKRIVGLPGELVLMTQGVVFINGRPLVEPFPLKRGCWTVKPGMVPANKYLLMGDNRELPEQTFYVVAKEAILARQF